MKVVIDTNVLVSGLLNPSGPPGRVVELLLNGDIEIVVDDRILAEYRRVLNNPEFPFSSHQVNTVLEFIDRLGVHVTSAPLRINLPDANDQPFLEVTRALSVETLVTGNLRHFPNIAEAVSPRDFIARWRSQS